MALYLLSDWLNDIKAIRPSHLMDQHFGLGLNSNDLVKPTQPERFQVNLDVQQFSPDELQVKVVDNSIVVEGKHEEKPDEHGYISRRFVRRYVLPEEYKLDAVASTLSSDGVLTVSAPRTAAIEGQEERVIPITHTGPSKAIKQSDNQNKQ